MLGARRREGSQLTVTAKTWLGPLWARPGGEDELAWDLQRSRALGDMEGVSSGGGVLSTCYVLDLVLSPYVVCFRICRETEAQKDEGTCPRSEGQAETDLFCFVFSGTGD